MLFISALVLAELTRGVLRLPKGKKKRDLVSWLARLESVFGERILPFELEAARVWGAMIARCEAKRIRPGVSNAQIAATGIRRGLVVVTRSVIDFAPTGARHWKVRESDGPL
ncbi:MAG: hypothetical protein KA152_14510 [Verrucomicrobiales bacterium]|nr:hypothetical protein [Verrucomicrobiales bacterium]HQW30587.1 hypothetical protein [Verrucomicrobiales bacterium]